MGKTPFGNNVICQVGLLVNDIQATARRYCEVFGVEMPPILETAGHAISKTTYHAEPCDATAKLAFFTMGQVQIELIEPDAQPSVWRDYLRGRLKSGSTPPCGPSPQAGRDFTLPFSLPLLAGEGPGIGVQKTSQMALNAHGEGVHHIAFQIEDTDRTAQHLKDHGIEVLQQGLYSDASGMYTYVDSEAVLGVMLELLQNF